MRTATTVTTELEIRVGNARVDSYTLQERSIIMKPGLYDLVQEYFQASPQRKAEIEAERKRLYPTVEGWPQYPDMVYAQVAQNVWGWDAMRGGMTYMDNDGNVVGGVY